MSKPWYGGHLIFQSCHVITQRFMFWCSQDEDATASLADVAATVRGQATIALEIIALVAMLPFVYIEVATIVEYGKSWIITQNIIDALTYINQVHAAIALCRTVPRVSRMSTARCDAQICSALTSISEPGRIFGKC